MKIKLDKMADMKKAIDEEFEKYVVSVADQAVDIIHAELRLLVGNLIETSTVYKSLRGYGELYGQVGIKSPGRNLDAIKAKIVENVFVDIRKIGKNIVIIFGVLEANYNDILSLPEASYVSVNTAGRSSPVYWLQWLLTADESPVVPGYYYKTPITPEEVSHSRTKHGLMRKIRKGGPTRGFNFEDPHAGTADDNFLTRVIDSATFYKEVENIFDRAIKTVVARMPQ